MESLAWYWFVVLTVIKKDLSFSKYLLVISMLFIIVHCKYQTAERSKTNFTTGSVQNKCVIKL